MQSPAAPQGITFTELVALVGALAAALTLIVGVFRLGGFSTDLKNTKDTVGRDVHALGTEMRRGFEDIKTRFAEDKEARHTNNNRLGELFAEHQKQLHDHETRLTVIERERES
jgi:hypothetical protein